MNTGLETSTPTTASGELATYLQQMREQERADLARELHDELGSLLTGAKLEVASLRARLGDGSCDVVQRLTHLSEIINSGISFSRRVVENLHPSSLTNLGLRASLEILAREFEQTTGIATAVDVEDVDLDEAARLTAYRVVQESLNNTSKHARATGARLVMIDCGSDVIMTVQDNGAGFDTAAKGTASHGLAGMRHRVSACGGQLIVSSAPRRRNAGRRSASQASQRSRVAAGATAGQAGGPVRQARGGQQVGAAFVLSTREAWRADSRHCREARALMCVNPARDQFTFNQNERP